MAAGGARSDLPYSSGLSFDGLDAYLEHRRMLSATGRPHYVLLPNGLYQRIAGRAGPKETYTRAELLEKYGFEE